MPGRKHRFFTMNLFFADKSFCVALATISRESRVRLAARYWTLPPIDVTFFGHTDWLNGLPANREQAVRLAAVVQLKQQAVPVVQRNRQRKV
jgi:hypothetical protein